MRNSGRLRPRSTFLKASRRVRVYFHTGSAAKYAQASFVFARLGLPLSGSPSAHPDGIEDYFGGVQQLIELKLRDVWLGQQTVYFVEDTYVRIEALSKPTDASPNTDEWAKATVPGLTTKEWFEGATFQDLDSRLTASGGDRRATVYSTIALHVPGVTSPQIFTGQIEGSIAHDPGDGLEQNQPYPWLSPNSFNAWFIPIGEDTPLSDLDLEQSLDVDFRVSALLALADRLEEYVAILNLPPVSVQLVPQETSLVQHGIPVRQQPQLFLTRRPPIVVIGLTCAGKTTLGQFISRYDYTHIEASSVLQALHGSNVALASRPGYIQAMTTLGLRGWDIVARQSVNLYAPFIESGICITGLRTVEELSYLVNLFDDLLIVLLEAPPEMRFDRYVRRGRTGEDLSLTRFREREREHANFGLINVADHCSTVRILNDSTLSDFEDIARLLAQTGPTISGPKVSRRGVGIGLALKSQIYRCARVLADAHGGLSPTDIETLQRRDTGLQVVKRNAVRKTLLQHPVFVRRESDTGGTTFYELTEHGHAYVSLIDALRSDGSYAELEDAGHSDAFSHNH